MKSTLYKIDQNDPVIVAYKTAIEKGRYSQHVIPHNGSWLVKSLDSAHTPQVFETFSEAIQVAESVAKSKKSSLFIHNTDGLIQDRIDF